MTGTRLATIADRDAVRDVIALAFAGYVERMGRRPAPMDADFTAALTDSRVWVIDRQDGIEGVLVVENRGDHLLIDTVAVHPAAQGRGYGAQLLGRAESEARAGGLSEVRLYTNEAMTENLAYYPRRGYQETGRVIDDGYRRVYFRKLITDAPFKI